MSTRRGFTRLALVAASLVVLATACGGGGPPPAQPSVPAPGTSASVPPSRPPKTTPPANGKALPLGTFTTTSVSGRCPAGEQCQGFQVVCPQVSQPASGTLAIGTAGSPRGVVVFFAGGRGTGFWGGTNAADTRSTLDQLHQAGLTTVRVAWTNPSWLFAAPGEAVGPRLLGCRPATAAKWVHDHIYAPIHARPSVGQCGFCLTGDSGGASQAAYALADYGLDSIINAAVLASGPVHTAMADGCLRRGNPDLWYTGFSQPIIDASYGFFGRGGPCASNDPAFTSKWNADSLDTGGRDFNYPKTRVEFIFGSDDQSGGPPHGLLFLAKLKSDKSPITTSETVAGMGHLVANSSQGLSALVKALLAT